MASYQIPQFLDSGDKILGPLNLRQFAYALGGFFLCIMIFTVIQSSIPGIGFYAIIPALPFAGLTAYIALGKYNGRDSEIYILKFIIYNLRPRVMMYRKVPYTTDLDEQAAMLTYDNILKEWNERASKLKSMENNELRGFESMDASERARKIREIGTQMDMGFYNTIRRVQQGQLKLAQQQAVLQSISAATNNNAGLPTNNRQGIGPNPVLATTAPITGTQQTDYDDVDQVNFFDLNK
jgi:hypothetical protein